MVKAKVHKYKLEQILWIKGFSYGRVERLFFNRHDVPCYSLRVLDENLVLYNKLYKAPEQELRTNRPKFYL